MNNLLTIQNVPFGSDVIPSTVDNNSIVWSIVPAICNNIGLTEDQKKRCVKNIQADIVLKDGCQKLKVKYDTQVREVLCIQDDYLPLWLAKISITPNMKEEQPEVVEKLKSYQLKAKDVLADYFFHKNKPLTAPLSREELATYMLYNERHTDVIEKMMSSFIDNQTKSTEQFMSNQTKVMDDFCKSMMSTFNGYMNIISGTLDIFKRLAETTVNSTDHSSVSIDIEAERWKANAFNMVNKICKEHDYGNGNLVLAKIYKLIHEKDGVDLAKKKNEYMLANNVPVTSTISYIAKFPELRKIFEKRAKEFSNSQQTDGTKQIPFSALVRATPKEVYDIAQPVFEKINGKNYALRLLYKEMENLSGISINDLTKEFATKHNVSLVSKGYIIGQEEHLMELLKKAVESLLVSMEET